MSFRPRLFSRRRNAACQTSMLWPIPLPPVMWNQRSRNDSWQICAFKRFRGKSHKRPHGFERFKIYESRGFAQRIFENKAPIEPLRTHRWPLLTSHSCQRSKRRGDVPGHTSPDSSMNAGTGKMGHQEKENISNRIRRLGVDRWSGGLDSWLATFVWVTGHFWRREESASEKTEPRSHGS